MNLEAKEFLEKAEQSLKVATWCLEQKHVDSCVNRSYYAVLQAAVAALLSVGESIPEGKRIHEWAQGAFPRECIKRRKLYAAKLKTYLSELQSVRDVADYSSDYVSERTAARALEKAKEFVLAIKSKMKEKV